MQLIIFAVVVISKMDTSDLTVMFMMIWNNRGAGIGIEYRIMQEKTERSLTQN